MAQTYTTSRTRMMPTSSEDGAHASKVYQGLAFGEQLAIQYLESKLQEYALKPALKSFTLEKFDGTIIKITAPPPALPPHL